MTYSLIIIVTGFFCCISGIWLARSVRNTHLEEGSAQTLIRYINEAVVTVSKPGFRQALLALVGLVAAMILFKLGAGEFHTGIIPLALLLGIGTAHLNARFFIRSSTSTLESAVYSCTHDLDQMPRKIMRGVLAMGLFLSGTVLMLLAGFITLLSHFFTVDTVPLIQKVSPMIRPENWDTLLSSHEMISHFLSLELVLALLALCLGVTIYALVVRIKSGLVAKTSDIAADTIGRAEFDLLEDDLRNPGVISDLAGDQLSNTLGNTLLLLECTLFLISVSAITAVLSYPEPYVLHHHAFTVLHAIFQPLGVLFCGAIASLLTLGMRKLKLIKITHLSSLLYPAYFLMPLLVYVCGYMKWLPEHSAPLAAFSGILGILIVAHIQWLLNLKNPAVRKLCDSLKVNSLTGVFHGLMIGIFAATIPTLGLGLVFFVVLKVHAGLPLPLLFHRLGISGVALLSPTLILAALGAFSSLADNVKGCSEMLMMPKEILEKTQQTDTDAESASAIVKVILILTGTLSIFFIPLLFLNRINHALHHYAFATSYDSLIDQFHIHTQNPLFLLGTLFGVFIVFIWMGLLLKAVKQGVEKAAEFIREQFNSKEGIWTGETLPDYHLFVQCVELNAKRWTWLLMASLVVMGMGTVLLLGVSGSMGVLLGATGTAFGLSLVCLLSGSLWKQAKKKFESEGDQKSSAYYACLFTDGLGDVFKDVLSPCFVILVKLMSVIMIVFGSVALWLN